MHYPPRPDDLPHSSRDLHATSMSKLTLDLPDELIAYADEQAFISGHEDRSSYVAGLIRQDRDKHELRERLIASIKSGPAGFADDQFFEELIEQAEAQAALRGRAGSQG